MHRRALRHWNAVAYPLTIFLLVLLLYAKTTGYGFVAFDDETFVLGNPLIQHLSWHSVFLMFTRFSPDEYLPLTHLSYAVEHALVGTEPFFYHLDNILLHAGNAVLVYLLLLQWSGKKAAAFFGAAFFAAHPLAVEATVWISARKDLLCAFFFLLSLLAYGRYRRMDRGGWYAISIGLFLLALLSKLLAVSLPVVILLDEYRSGRPLKRGIVRALPFAVMGALFGAAGLYGKAPNVGNLPFPSFVALGAKASLFTFMKILLPLHLSIIYPQLTPPDPFALDMALSMASVLILFVGIICIAQVRSREIFYPFGFFLATLAPAFFVLRRASGLYVGEDKFAYLPMIAVASVLGMTTAWLWQKERWRSVIVMLCAALLAAFGILSLQRMPVWHDSTSLFTDAVERNPEWPLVRYALAEALARQGKEAEARTQMHEGFLLHRRRIREERSNAAAFSARGDASLAALEQSLADVDDAFLERAMTFSASLR